MRDVETLRNDDRTTYEEGVEILKHEAKEDEQAKIKHGTARWTRLPSKQAAENLYTQVGEIDGYLKSASGSDELVKSKLKDCESALKILEGTDHDLEAYIPSSRRATIPPKLEAEAGKLRAVLADVNRLESRRRRRVEAVLNKGKADDISKSKHIFFTFEQRLTNHRLRNLGRDCPHRARISHAED